MFEFIKSAPNHPPSSHANSLSKFTLSRGFRFVTIEYLCRETLSNSLSDREDVRIRHLGIVSNESR